MALLEQTKLGNAVPLLHFAFPCCQSTYGLSLSAICLRHLLIMLLSWLRRAKTIGHGVGLGTKQQPESESQAWSNLSTQLSRGFHRSAALAHSFVRPVPRPELHDGLQAVGHRQHRGAGESMIDGILHRLLRAICKVLDSLASRDRAKRSRGRRRKDHQAASWVSCVAGSIAEVASSSSSRAGCLLWTYSTHFGVGSPRARVLSSWTPTEQVFCNLSTLFISQLKTTMPSRLSTMRARHRSCRCPKLRLPPSIRLTRFREAYMLGTRLAVHSSSSLQHHLMTTSDHHRPACKVNDGLQTGKAIGYSHWQEGP